MASNKEETWTASNGFKIFLLIGGILMIIILIFTVIRIMNSKKLTGPEWISVLLGVIILFCIMMIYLISNGTIKTNVGNDCDRGSTDINSCESIGCQFDSNKCVKTKHYYSALWNFYKENALTIFILGIFTIGLILFILLDGIALFSKKTGLTYHVHRVIRNAAYGN
tara:strand:+ start:492 stop:992 length:501 start_codon:yes stop_codon:yes gene_type:complete